ncbi:MAG TPA: response regulator transcription factor [Gemmatimonadaceae bacterium]|nr:response regulator transcription factor [Gemmatimonadaceae bacterium]
MTHPADAPITIVTADDHPLIRDGLAAVLRAESGLQVVAEAANGEEAIEAYARLHPDIVLMDLRMPVMDGLTATRAILADDPNARIIVLTTYDGDEDIHRALAAGARGYILKDMMRTDLVGAIRAVHRGQRGIPAPVAARLAEHTPRIGLTPRELEVLRLVADGLSNAQVAERIGRTEGTVKVHLKNILQKLDVKDRTEAVTTALRRGFIRLD